MKYPIGIQSFDQIMEEGYVCVDKRSWFMAWHTEAGLTSWAVPVVGTADEAIRQIREEGYAREYESDSRTIYKIGAAFSSETGTITDWECMTNE